MNQTKKELSYFRLKLEGYLRDHHPELVAKSAFIGARADLALSSYCDSVAQGFSHLEAEAMASEVLYQGLHYPKVGACGWQGKSPHFHPRGSRSYFPPNLVSTIAPLPLSCSKKESAYSIVGRIKY